MGAGVGTGSVIGMVAPVTGRRTDVAQTRAVRRDELGGDLSRSDAGLDRPDKT